MEITTSSILDILSLFKIPTTSLNEMWNPHCENKLAESRDILFDEIKQGNFNNIGYEGITIYALTPFFDKVIELVDFSECSI